MEEQAPGSGRASTNQGDDHEALKRNDRSTARAGADFTAALVVMAEGFFAFPNPAATPGSTPGRPIAPSKVREYGDDMSKRPIHEGPAYLGKNLPADFVIEESTEDGIKCLGYVFTFYGAEVGIRTELGETSTPEATWLLRDLAVTQHRMLLLKHETGIDDDAELSRILCAREIFSTCYQQALAYKSTTREQALEMARDEAGLMARHEAELMAQATADQPPAIDS